MSGRAPTGQALVSETWKPVPGYEGLYEVSDLGRLRSFHSGAWRILRGGCNPDGYPVVNLYQNGRRYSTQLHQLVCQIFNGDPTALHCEVGHLDGDRTNARAANLKWVSKPENHYHKRLHGTHQAGEKHPRAKITAAQATEIRRRALSGEGATALGREYGIHESAVRDIRDGKRWRSAP